MMHIPLYVLPLIRTSLEEAANSWERLRAHFYRKLDDHSIALTSPQKHDQLLLMTTPFPARGSISGLWIP